MKHCKKLLLATTVAISSLLQSAAEAPAPPKENRAQVPVPRDAERAPEAKFTAPALPVDVHTIYSPPYPEKKGKVLKAPRMGTLYQPKNAGGEAFMIITMTPNHEELAEIQEKLAKQEVLLEKARIALQKADDRVNADRKVKAQFPDIVAVAPYDEAKNLETQRFLRSLLDGYELVVGATRDKARKKALETEPREYYARFQNARVTNVYVTEGEEIPQRAPKEWVRLTNCEEMRVPLVIPVEHCKEPPQILTFTSARLGQTFKGQLNFYAEEKGSLRCDYRIDNMEGSLEEGDLLETALRK